MKFIARSVAAVAATVFAAYVVSLYVEFRHWQSVASVNTSESVALDREYERVHELRYEKDFERGRQWDEFLSPHTSERKTQIVQSQRSR